MCLRNYITMFFLDGPTMTIYPITTAGDKMNAVMLFCVVDSNPPPKYHWTKGNSREVSALFYIYQPF